MILLDLLILVVALILDGIIAGHMRDSARLKGYDENYHIFAICFWLGLPGGIYVASLPDLLTRKILSETREILEHSNKQ